MWKKTAAFIRQGFGNFPVCQNSYIILEDKLQDQNIDLKEETAIENILINIKKNEKQLSWQEFNISKMRIQKRRTNIQRMNEILYDLYY